MVNILGKYKYFITWSIWACKLQQKKWIPRKHVSFMIVLSYVFPIQLRQTRSPITSNHPFCENVGPHRFHYVGISCVWALQKTASQCSEKVFS